MYKDHNLQNDAARASLAPALACVLLIGILAFAQLVATGVEAFKAYFIASLLSGLGLFLPSLPLLLRGWLHRLRARSPESRKAEAAKELGVTNHVIRRLIRDGILPANQVVDGAPYQIRTADLHSDKVKNALARKGRPCRADLEDQLSMFPRAYEGGA